VSEFVFGTHNAAFVQVMYEQYLRDPSSVGEEWRELFDNGRQAELPIIPMDRAEILREEGRGTGEGYTTAPTAPAAPSSTLPSSPVPLPRGAVPITGPAARLVANMTDSLSVPTATSFRDINATTLDTRRKAMNAQLASSGKKISFTHLIGYAIVQAAKHFPVMTHVFQEIEGKPHRVDPGAIGLGLAVDVEKKDGSRALVVPVIKHAEAMDFAAFHAAYEALVEKARTNRLMPDDFAGGTIQLTNPGTLGTVASVPRLM
jgi:pyruvate/2-oxoglutarate dehydrogenase complex dihydrolipoamide acyltransferase (E2) component